MSKKRAQIRYPGMERSLQTSQAAPLLVRPTPGRPDLVQLSLNVAMAAPDVALFADYVDVSRGQDGMRILFGKMHPLKPGTCIQAVEISFPFHPFVSQLVKTSIVDSNPGDTTFQRKVEAAIEPFGYVPIENLEAPKEIMQLVAFRSNLTNMALHDDDAAVDFYHLDAATMHAVMTAAAGTGQAPTAGFKGVMRIVVSPMLLAYFLKKCAVFADELTSEIPRLKDPGYSGR